jgi:hypothetical protein
MPDPVSKLCTVRINIPEVIILCFFYKERVKSRLDPFIIQTNAQGYKFIQKEHPLLHLGL